jgi:hypothetical protein
MDAKMLKENGRSEKSFKTECDNVQEEKIKTNVRKHLYISKDLLRKVFADSAKRTVA